MCDCQAKSDAIPTAQCSVRQLNFTIEEDTWFDYVAALAAENIYVVGVSVVRSNNKKAVDMIKVSMVPTQFVGAVRIIKKFDVKNLSAFWASVVTFDQISEYKQLLATAEGEEDTINIETLFYDNKDNIIVTTNTSPVAAF